MFFKASICGAALFALSAILLPASAEKDYFPDKASVKYGAGFEIKYQGNAKFIRNKISQETYVLYQSGTEIPNGVTPTPADSIQVGNWTKVFAVPGKNVVLDSAPASAIIELLGLQSTVGGAYKYFEITSPCMQKLLSSVTRIGQGWDVPRAASRRSRLSRRVYYDIGNNGFDWTFTSYGMSDPRSIAVNPESATDMLGKAEWIKFIAAFYNKEAEANRIFGEIEARYNKLKDSVDQESKRKIGFARYNRVANGTVRSWTIEQPQPWFVQGLADAGLTAHSGDVTAFSSVSEFYKAAASWDILIDTSLEPLPHGGATIPQWTHISSGYRFDGSDPVPKLSFLSKSCIYRTDLVSSYSNATDYNEHFQVQPDLLLADFIKLASSNGATSTQWHRNLPRNVPVNWKSASDCQK